MIYTRTAAQPDFWFCQYPSSISTARWVNRALGLRSAGCSNLSKRLKPCNCIFRKETASNKQFHFCGNLIWNNTKLIHNVGVSILQSVRMAHKGFYAGLLCFWGMHCLFLGTFPGGEGGRCVRLTTSPPSCAECHKPPGNLWDTPSLLRDCFSFLLDCGES
jgi:hypothetical protein